MTCVHHTSPAPTRPGIRSLRIAVCMGQSRQRIDVFLSFFYSLFSFSSLGSLSLSLFLFLFLFDFMVNERSFQIFFRLLLRKPIRTDYRQEYYDKWKKYWTTVSSIPGNCKPIPNCWCSLRRRTSSPTRWTCSLRKRRAYFDGRGRNPVGMIWSWIHI